MQQKSVIVVHLLYMLLYKSCTTFCVGKIAVFNQKKGILDNSMSKKSRIDIRVEDEIISMLNVLENQELTENFVSKKRSEIIIDAIKTYYTMHANGKNQSQLSNMIDAQLRQIIEPLFQSQADLISKCYSVTNRNISIYNEQELKTLQLILMGTQLENDEAYVEKLLNKNPVFIKVINKKVSEMLKEREK